MNIVKNIFKREKSIFINASPEKVFRYLANILGHSEWAANTLDITHIKGPKSGEGAIFKTVIHRPAGITGSFKGQIRILIEEYPNRFVYEASDTTGVYRWSFLFATEREGCYLTQQMEKISGPWILGWIQPTILWPLIGSRQVQTGLENIKLNLEK